MVENVALDVFVVVPLLVAAEGIDLQRHSEFGGLQLTYHHRKIVVELRVVIEVSLDIGTENAQIGLLAPIHDFTRVDMISLIVFGDVFLAFCDVIFHQGVMFVFFKHLWRAIMDGVHVNVDASGDASSVRLRHAAPIGEGR